MTRRCVRCRPLNSVWDFLYGLGILYGTLYELEVISRRDSLSKNCGRQKYFQDESTVDCTTTPPLEDGFNLKHRSPDRCPCVQSSDSSSSSSVAVAVAVATGCRRLRRRRMMRITPTTSATPARRTASTVATLSPPGMV
jgi:hypothetical protein